MIETVDTKKHEEEKIWTLSEAAFRHGGREVDIYCPVQAGMTRMIVEMPRGDLPRVFDFRDPEAPGAINLECLFGTGWELGPEVIHTPEPAQSRSGGFSHALKNTWTRITKALSKIV